MSQVLGKELPFPPPFPSERRAAALRSRAHFSPAGDERKSERAGRRVIKGREHHLRPMTEALGQEEIRGAPIDEWVLFLDFGSGDGFAGGLCFRHFDETSGLHIVKIAVDRNMAGNQRM